MVAGGAVAGGAVAGGVASGPPSDPGQPWAAQPAPDQYGSGQAGYSAPRPNQPGPGQPGGTLTSHRREFGITGPGEPGQPGGAQPPPGRPRGPRWYREPRWIALAAVLVLLLAGLGVWAGLSGSGSHHGTAMPTMSAKPKPKKPTESALMKALVVTNRSNEAKGLLPPSTCKQDSQVQVTCTAPATGISAVIFQIFPNLTALYAAYMDKVSSLNSGQFKQNFNDCESQVTYGEVAWNHLFQHPKIYTVDQMTNTGFTDDKAAGRVFCNFTQGLEYMVWTQNDGHVMGVVAGPVHGDVWNWWVAIHHNIGLGGSMNMNMNPTPSASMSGMSGSPSASMSSMGG